MGTNGIHPRVLKDLTDVTVRPLLIIFQWFWKSGEVAVTEAGRCGPKRPDKIVEVVIVENTEKHLKDSAVIGCSQRGFTMGKIFLMNFL